MPTDPENALPSRTLKCSICGASARDAYRPFCSKRCADVDLGRWLTGRYAISGSTDDDEDGAAPEDATGHGPEPDAKP
jgi:uncharacterized protein